MKIYKQELSEGQEIVILREAAQTFCTDSAVYFVVSNNVPPPVTGMEEVTQAEYEAAGGVIPGDHPKQPSLEELKENQLILMDALATLYETVTGGA